MTNNTVPSFDNVVVLKDEQKNWGAFQGSLLSPGPGCPGSDNVRMKGARAGRGACAFQSLCFLFFLSSVSVQGAGQTAF